MQSCNFYIHIYFYILVHTRYIPQLYSYIDLCTAYFREFLAYETFTMNVPSLNAALDKTSELHVQMAPQC